MENFQLYRTNILLGGQMKWDLIVDNSSNGLIISDLHLSPISRNIPYIQQSDEHLLISSHADNVKEYYKHNESNFYSSGLNTVFEHNWPVVVNNGETAYTYNDIYDMGCRRARHYDIYNKQIEFFCPIWMEHMSGDIEFDIKLVDDSTTNTIASKKLVIKKDDYSTPFNKYFNEYVKSSGIADGKDEVMYVSFNEGKSYITGLNVKTGIQTIKDVSSVVDIMTTRERPLMETDNMLISNFNNSHIIVNQLFNFNLCFNISDIVTPTIEKLILGKSITISVNVYINDEELMFKDFDTEYDFIQKQFIYNATDKEHDPLNVLDYLGDNKCIDLVCVNKFSQQVCHWSLCDKNDYIFNVYDGFSGYSIDEDGNVVETKHHYGGTPMIDYTKFNTYTNGLGWLNVIKFELWKDFNLFVSTIKKHKSKLSELGSDSFVNGIKYLKKPDVPICFCGIQVNENTFIKISNNYDNIKLDNKLMAIVIDNVSTGKEKTPGILFIAIDGSDLLYQNIISKLNTVKNNDVLKNFADIIESYITPSVINIKSSLFIKRVDSPTNQTNEITYYKDNIHGICVLRYDGKIKPTFTTDRTMYYKDYISDYVLSGGLSNLKMSIYGRYSDFEPKYKSIGYYSIRSQKMEYDKTPTITVSEYPNGVSLISTPEYNWFNIGKMICLKPEHNFTVNKETDTSLDDIVTEYIKKQYGTDHVEYIKDCYNIDLDCRYLNNIDLDKFRYNIKMKLK